MSFGGPGSKASPPLTTPAHALIESHITPLTFLKKWHIKLGHSRVLMTCPMDFILTLGSLENKEPLAKERALEVEKRKATPTQDKPVCQWSTDRDVQLTACEGPGIGSICYFQVSSLYSFVSAELGWIPEQVWCAAKFRTCQLWSHIEKQKQNTQNTMTPTSQKPIKPMSLFCLGPPWLFIQNSCSQVFKVKVMGRVSGTLGTS